MQDMLKYYHKSNSRYLEAIIEALANGHTSSFQFRFYLNRPQVTYKCQRLRYSLDIALQNHVGLCMIMSNYQTIVVITLFRCISVFVGLTIFHKIFSNISHIFGYLNYWIMTTLNYWIIQHRTYWEYVVEYHESHISLSWI